MLENGKNKAICPENVPVLENLKFSFASDSCKYLTLESPVNKEKKKSLTSPHKKCNCVNNYT